MQTNNIIPQVSAQADESLIRFLKTILPNEGFKCWVEITPKKKVIQGFVNNVEELTIKLVEIDSRGSDAYHACASFASPQNRRAGNVAFLQCFRADIDVGEGKPYATVEDAIQACDNFCDGCSLPLPGMIRSGGGIHAYWTLDRPLTSAEWLPVAQRLKLLMASHNFHADATCTADPARILRPPGTKNYKLSTPRNVEVDDWECFEPVDAEGFIAAVMAKTPVMCAPAPASLNGNFTAGISKAFDATKGVARGCRGSTRIRYAGELVAKGLSSDEILAKLLAWDALCQPPEGEAACIHSMKSALSMHAAKHPVNAIWPEPLPLTEKLAAQPYPLNALPDTIHAAVDEVQGFVQAPVAMVASSALAAVSLAGQGRIDVKRDEKLTGPVSLFFLTVADSGERKSTCDGFFMTSIRDYEKLQEELAKPKRKDYQAKLKVWESKRAGLGDAIRKAMKATKDIGNVIALEGRLIELEKEKPMPPTVPRLIYSDATPEALTNNLAKAWPSGGIVSSEGGIVFGAHGMNKETIMRNLATYNVLWDGGTYQSDRKTVDSFSLHGARLTIALQVQEVTLRSFFDRSQGLARGSGFLARFLMSYPESTQGYRPFITAPANWPHLAVFHRRITAILEKPSLIMPDGSLMPTVVPLSPEAKVLWIQHHDVIEKELRTGGLLQDVRDVASKVMDNAARLAGLFHVFDGDGAGTISVKHMQAACTIAIWHLHESQRFFREIALPVEMMNAERLDRWLLSVCKKENVSTIGRRRVQQSGPVRDSKVLDAALSELVDLNRVRVVMDGKRKDIQINPPLLAGSP